MTAAGGPTPAEAPPVEVDGVVTPGRDAAKYDEVYARFIAQVERERQPAS